MKKVVALVVAMMMMVSGAALAEGKKVSIQGSTSVTPLMEKLVAGITEVECEVQGTGSSAGIKAAIDGTAQIGMSSRALKEEEAAQLNCTTIAMDGIAIVVNAENPVSDLTVDQASQIFKGEVTNWKELGGEDAPIVLVSREAGSGTRDAFEEMLKLTGDMNGTTISLVDLAYPLIATGNGEIKQNVATKKNAIGYISLGSVDETLKAVAIDGAAATTENVKNGSYKIARPFNLVVKGEATDEAKVVLNFIASEEGKAIIEGNSYIVP